MKSKLIEGNHGTAVKSEVEFRDKFQKIDWSILKDGRIDLAKKLIKKYKIRGNVLEMGSGHSWMTAMISKSQKVNEAWCVECSEKLIKEIAPKTFSKLHADISKITRIFGSFYDIPCEDNFFDFIIFEASFHHVQDYDKIFQELKRILKKGGTILCTRERYLPINKYENIKKFKDYSSRGILERTFTIPEYRFLAELHHFYFKTDPFYWYPDKNRKLKHWFKYIVEKIPYLNRSLAYKTCSLVMVMYQKPYNIEE